MTAVFVFVCVFVCVSARLCWFSSQRLWNENDQLYVGCNTQCVYSICFDCIWYRSLTYNASISKCIENARILRLHWGQSTNSERKRKTPCIFIQKLHLSLESVIIVMCNTFQPCMLWVSVCLTHRYYDICYVYTIQSAVYVWEMKHSNGMHGKGKIRRLIG